ncbi:MAG: ImmA/IrrE family metallo-endopeptidase [Oscillospiraceae bacterium]|nr:ImmA/IrrE family metallo-endopeptidase [Oscillospiraceae bacterium]
MQSAYGKYKYARNASWSFLIDHSIQALPVSISKILRADGIKLGRYSENTKHFHVNNLTHLTQNDGFTVLDAAGRLFVYYNDAASIPRIRFTLAHELGHIYLGHLNPKGGYTILNREPSSQDNPREMQANVFASRILAPACVLWRLNIHDPADIAALCGISTQSAQFRAARMEVLYQREKEWLKTCGRSCFLQKEKERIVLSQFKDYIEQRSKKNGVHK